MAEPDQIQVNEHVEVSRARTDARSIPARIGVVAGSALLIVVGTVAAMGASPAPVTTSVAAPLAAGAAPQPGALGAPVSDLEVAALEFGPGGFDPAGVGPGAFGRGGFHGVTISAINGSNLSLKTDDGWTRTITVGSSTTISRGGATIAVGDLAVGDQIRFRQEKAADGTYTITAIGVVLPAIAGQVTAISGNTMTVTGMGGTTGTIHVDADTTYSVDGTKGKALSDVTVGTFVLAVGTLRADGSLDADAVHSRSDGPRGLRDGRGPGLGFRFHGLGSPDHVGIPGASPSSAAAPSES